jgi:GNAT superfamily N-acetyltransferase
VPRFITPAPEQIRSVLADSHALWGAGLSSADYIAMWEDLARVPWARSWYSWRALVETDGRVLSSLKLYRPLVRLGDTSGRVAAIGAVFTPRPFRRRGHAAALIRAALDEATERGDAAALLFTDIGTDYYRAFGFAPLPCEDALGTLTRAPAAAADGVTFRAMTKDDLDAVVAAHAAASASRPIAVVRDRGHWEFLLDRAAAFFHRLDGSGLERRFAIAEHESRPLGYLVAVLAPGEWNLREAAAYDGDPRNVARASGASTVWGWIPRDLWTAAPAWRLRSQPRLRAIPMIRALGGRILPDRLDTLDGAFIPYLDQF